MHNGCILINWIIVGTPINSGNSESSIASHLASTQTIFQFITVKVSYPADLKFSITNK